MRAIPALLLVTLLASGCSSEPQDDAGPAGSDGDGPGLNATAPEPLHWDADVIAGADPFNLLPDPNDPLGGNLPECSQAPAGQDVSCHYYEFTVNTTVKLEATLAWGVAANDLDLYLYNGQAFVSNDGINSIGIGVPSLPSTTQVMSVDGLAPGTYTFRVVLWNAVADSYTLDAVFT